MTVTYEGTLPRPQVGSVAEQLYDALRQLAWADADNAWALLRLCEAIGRMWQSLDDLISDTDEAPGWSLLVDVDRAPGRGAEIDVLPWLGQLVGVRGLESLGDDERRETIRRRDGFRRGTPDSILSYASRFLVRDGVVTLRERIDTTLGPAVDAPWRGQVRIRTAHLLPGTDMEALRAAVLSRIPAGIVYDVVFTDERDWVEVSERWATWGAVAAGGLLWTDVNTA